MDAWPSRYEYVVPERVMLPSPFTALRSVLRVELNVVAFITVGKKAFVFYYACRKKKYIYIFEVFSVK